MEPLEAVEAEADPMLQLCAHWLEVIFLEGLKLPLERKISSNMFTVLSQEMAIKTLPHSALEVSCLSP